MSVRPRPGCDTLLPGANRRFSIIGWCHQHDLHPDLIPVPMREVEEWDRLKKINGVIDGLGKFELAFRRTQYLTDTECADTHLTPTYLWLAGSFPTHDTQKGMHYYNPNYAHGPEHAEKMHGRMYHIQNAIELPTVRSTDVAERFGMSDKAMYQWLYRNVSNFKKRQDASKATIGRSILTSAAWSDYSVRELCKRIPNKSLSAVEDWCYVLARRDGWTVPDKPTETKWYGSV